MIPLINILLRPVAHGAVGFWDEVLNIIPLVFGGGLLFYLYFGARKRRSAEAHPGEAAAEPAAPKDDPPQP